MYGDFSFSLSSSLSFAMIEDESMKTESNRSGNCLAIFIPEFY
jgi:hypothetical protein